MILHLWTVKSFTSLYYYFSVTHFFENSWFEAFSLTNSRWKQSHKGVCMRRSIMYPVHMVTVGGIDAHLWEIHLGKMSIYFLWSWYFLLGLSRMIDVQFRGMQTHHGTVCLLYIQLWCPIITCMALISLQLTSLSWV